jgi:hypothetical protein
MGFPVQGRMKTIKKLYLFDGEEKIKNELRMKICSGNCKSL